MTCNRFRSQMKDSNQEFANSNTCCPGVEDQWQGRAPSDILTSESKQLNRGTTLMYMSVISCWMHSIDCGNAATTLKITQSSAKKERTLARFGLACSNFVETECLIVVQVILFKNRLWLFNYPYAGSIVLWQSSTQLQIATHCGTLVECPHLKRTKTMHFHSFFWTLP